MNQNGESLPAGRPAFLALPARTAGKVQLRRPQQVHAISLQNVACHLAEAAPKRPELVDAWSAM
jgi:hypothetical protein